MLPLLLPSIPVQKKHQLLVPKHRTAISQHLARPWETASNERPTEYFGIQHSPECKMVCSTEFTNSPLLGDTKIKLIIWLAVSSEHINLLLLSIGQSAAMRF